MKWRSKNGLVHIIELGHPLNAKLLENTFLSVRYSPHHKCNIIWWAILFGEQQLGPDSLKFPRWKKSTDFQFLRLAIAWENSHFPGRVTSNKSLITTKANIIKNIIIFSNFSLLNGNILFIKSISWIELQLLIPAAAAGVFFKSPAVDFYQCTFLTYFTFQMVGSTRRCARRQDKWWHFFGSISGLTNMVVASGKNEASSCHWIMVLLSMSLCPFLV